jgi:hypothetical protein
MPSRRFDSLRQAVRAFDLLSLWERERHAQRTRNAAIVCMPNERVDRTRRAADYLHRRVMREQSAP